jgi:hypothetical protein
MLLGSLLIFAGKGITYIDAMLFAAGATSQAGMNPINMNLLNTWQQVIPQGPKRGLTDFVASLWYSGFR